MKSSEQTFSTDSFSEKTRKAKHRDLIKMVKYIYNQHFLQTSISHQQQIIQSISKGESIPPSNWVQLKVDRLNHAKFFKIFFQLRLGCEHSKGLSIMVAWNVEVFHLGRMCTFNRMIESWNLFCLPAEPAHKKFPVVCTSDIIS